MNRKGLSESFNKAAQTLEESTDSARKMLESLQQDGKLLIAPRKESMKVFVNTSFRGHYPVGTSAVVIAKNAQEAAEMLTVEVSAIRTQTIKAEDMIEVKSRIASVTILQSGDY